MDWPWPCFAFNLLCPKAVTFITGNRRRLSGDCVCVQKQQHHVGSVSRAALHAVGIQDQGDHWQWRDWGGGQYSTHRTGQYNVTCSLLNRHPVSSHPVSQTFSQHCHSNSFKVGLIFQTVLMLVWLVMAVSRPFKEDRWVLLLLCLFPSGMLWCSVLDLVEMGRRLLLSAPSNPSGCSWICLRFFCRIFQLHYEIDTILSALTVKLVVLIDRIVAASVSKEWSGKSEHKEG